MINWREERIERTLFPVDGEGAKAATPYLPLRSTWLLRATGMWVRVWSWADSVPGHAVPDFAASFDVLEMTEFEGYENGSSIYQLVGGRGVYSPLEPSSGPGTPQNLLGNIQTANGLGCGGTRFYELPDTGAAYAALCLQVYPIITMFDEPESPRLCDPIWAAARILYRVEH